MGLLKWKAVRALVAGLAAIQRRNGRFEAADSRIGLERNFRWAVVMRYLKRSPNLRAVTKVGYYGL